MIKINKVKPVYLSKDGREFLSPNECLAHEAALFKLSESESIVKLIPHSEQCPPFADDFYEYHWYFVTCQTTIDALNVVFFGLNADEGEIPSFSALHGPCWILITLADSGDTEYGGTFAELRQSLDNMTADFQKQILS